MPQLDYIVGTPSVAFRSYDTLPQLVYDAAHLQNSLDLIVWSQATGKVRQISVEPEITEDGVPLLGMNSDNSIWNSYEMVSRM
jgi:hypothetical protein